MSPAPLTRRGLVRAAGAALGASALAGATPTALAAGSPPTAAPGAADADLFALLSRYPAALAEADAAGAAETDLWLRAVALYPARPAALRIRFGDVFPGGVKELGLDGRWLFFYDEAAVDSLREAALPTMWDCTNDGEDQRPVEVPDARRIARRAEIIEAHDRWRAECGAVGDRLGFAAAAAAETETADRLTELERAILATSPRTTAGLGAKARWASRPELSDPTRAIWSARIMADVIALVESDEVAV